MNDAVVRLFIPQATQKDEPFFLRLQRLETGPKLHGGPFPLGPPMLRVESHTGESHQRPRGGGASARVRRCVANANDSSHGNAIETPNPRSVRRETEAGWVAISDFLLGERVSRSNRG